MYLHYFTLLLPADNAAGRKSHFFHSQGSHRLEKYLKIQDCLEKSLKIKFALKSIWKTLKSIEKSLNFTIYRGFNTVFEDLNQYEILVPLFGAAYAAPNKGTIILYLFSKTNIFSNAV